MFFGIALKALAVWAGILMLAVLNGALREAVLIPKLGTAAGFVLSAVFLQWENRYGIVFDTVNHHRGDVDHP